METRANFVLIGAFTLAVIAAAFGFVLWFQSLHTTKARSPLRIVFEGPAAGLRNSRSGYFNGIPGGGTNSVKNHKPPRSGAPCPDQEKTPLPHGNPVAPEFHRPNRVATA